MWGNDPGYSGNGPLAETWLNPDVTMPHYGYQCRLNGPVDNAASACLSCHGTAQVQANKPPPPSMIPAAGENPAPWFRNLRPGEPFMPPAISTDYSLQVALGIANFKQYLPAIKAPTPKARQMLMNQLQEGAQTPPRDGGATH
jgi:hypothetical protein